MDRITEKQLQAVVDRINRITNSPMVPYAKVGDKYVAQIGNYHLSHAYGGVSLERMSNDGGGVTQPFGCGHVSKRDLYNRMQAFLSGLDAGKGE